SALVVQSACPLYWIRPRRASPLFPYPTLFRSLPSAAGRLMQAEVEALTRALDEPERPVAALVGGAKVSTKLELLGNLIERVDLMVLGGGMANTFLFANGVPIGKSLAEKEMADTAREIMAKAKE